MLGATFELFGSPEFPQFHKKIYADMAFGLESSQVCSVPQQDSACERALFS